MEPLVLVHVVSAAALLLVALVVGVWGLVRARSIGEGAGPREGKAYAQLLQLSHTLVAVTGVLGLALLGYGGHLDDPLHGRVYGPFMVVAIVAAYGYRTSDAPKNVRVFAVASLVVLALGLRAFATGG